MKVTVRYFASLREALGDRQELTDLAVGATVGDLRRHLCAASQAHATALASGRAVRCALNQVMVDESAVVPDAAEVAFFPPVTGG